MGQLREKYIWRELNALRGKVGFGGLDKIILGIRCQTSGFRARFHSLNLKRVVVAHKVPRLRSACATLRSGRQIFDSRSFFAETHREKQVFALLRITNFEKGFDSQRWRLGVGSVVATPDC